jgi:hypothetical protein
MVAQCAERQGHNMKDYDVWEKYLAGKAADKKAKEEAKYEAGKRALDSKYDQKKKSEEIVRAAKLKMANDAVESHRRAGNLAGGKPQYVKDNEKRIKDWEAKQSAKKADDKSTKVTKKEVTVETPTGNIGSRNSFDAGEVSPFANRKAEAIAEKVIDYPSRTADEVDEKITEAKAADEPRFSANNPMGMKKGGSVRAKPKAKCMASGGSTSSKASSRGDGCAQRGKTRGRMV